MAWRWDAGMGIQGLPNPGLGNILKIEYPRTKGAGDMFKLDGFERLVEAKLGVPEADMGKPYDQAGYNDRKIAYALDQAHNRDKVDIWDSSGHSVIDYILNQDSNRYDQVGQTALTYDGNGNLTFDGQYVYVYDYLDRLCEVWEYVVSPQAKSAAPPNLTQKDIAYLLAAARSKYKGWDILHKGAPEPKSLSAPAELVPVAYYGYDPYGRRVLKSIDTGSWWYAWDGWRRTDEYHSSDNANFEPHRTFFDGRGIDEHLGYAVYTPGTPGNPGTWTRYTFLQGSLGHIRAVVNDAGQVVERYDYDPYGRRRVYAPDWTPRNKTIIENDYGYTGRVHDDESGLVYYRYRYYDPSIGRFLTQDPIGNWTDASNWGNGYAYVASMPNQGMDPWGLQGSLFKNALGAQTLKARMHAREVPDLLNGGKAVTPQTAYTDPAYPPPEDTIMREEDSVPPNGPKRGCNLSFSKVHDLYEKLMASAWKSPEERDKVSDEVVKDLEDSGHLFFGKIEDPELFGEITADFQNPPEWFPGATQNQVIILDFSKGKMLDFKRNVLGAGALDEGQSLDRVVKDFKISVLLHELVHMNQLDRRCNKWSKHEMEADAYHKQWQFLRLLKMSKYYRGKKEANKKSREFLSKAIEGIEINYSSEKYWYLWQRDKK